MKKLLLFLSALILLNSCKLQFEATYDAGITENALSARVYCHNLYDSILADSTKTYDKFKLTYATELVMLKNLEYQESIRPHGKILQDQAHRILNQFIVFQSDHAVNVTLSPMILSGYQALMDDLFRSYLTSQNSLNGKPQ